MAMKSNTPAQNQRKLFGNVVGGAVTGAVAGSPGGPGGAIAGATIGGSLAGASRYSSTKNGKDVNPWLMAGALGGFSAFMYGTAGKMMKHGMFEGLARAGEEYQKVLSKTVKL